MERRPQSASVRIRDEQDIGGYVVQQLYFLAQSKLQRVLFLQGHRGNKLRWLFPSNLAALENRREIVVPRMEVMLRDHTRLPLYRPFVTSQVAEKLETHHIGKRVPRMAAYVATIGSMTETQFGICTDCVKEDYKEPGYAVSRRLFLVPGILACPTHRRALLTFCKGCQKKRYFNLLPEYMVPGLICPCGKPLAEMVELDDAGLEAAVAIAVMTWQMLRGLSPKNISPENLRKAIFQSFDYSDALPGPKRADQLRNTF